MKDIAAFSGGKDSAAVMLYARPKYAFFTPTGNEPADVMPFIEGVCSQVGAELIVPEGPSLQKLICEWRMLPNFRARWCTKNIKVLPAIAWLEANPDFRMLVGLRADEEERDGILGLPSSRLAYPLREAGMDLGAVMQATANVGVPVRTDCAWCFWQRLGEWHWLWRTHRDMWARGESFEAWTRHTFRSPSRDTWPASMRGLRARFEAGDTPRNSQPPFGKREGCRVCSM